MSTVSNSHHKKPLSTKLHANYPIIKVNIYKKVLQNNNFDILYFVTKHNEIWGIISSNNIEQ